MRDFENNPLQKGEIPSYEDLYELFIVQNLNKPTIGKIINRVSSVGKYLKIYGLKKTKDQRNECRRQTNLEKYGCINVSQCNKIKDKKQQTFLAKYGCENPMQNEQVKNKLKQNNIKKYGVESPMQTKEVKQKLQNTMLQRYGETNPGKVRVFDEKRKETLIAKYGTTNIRQVKEIKDKIKKTNLSKYGKEYLFGSEYFDQKRKETWMKNLGVNNPGKSEKVRKKLRDKAPEMLKKMNASKKANTSFNTSKPEERVYKQLNERFQVIRQYSSNDYPFACDFYIPSLDLYIECHISWTHGTKPFNENDKECIEKLNQWKNKAQTSDYFKNAIYIWTDLDVRKKQISESSKLNILFFYNENDFNEWYESCKF